MEGLVVTKFSRNMSSLVLEVGEVEPGKVSSKHVSSLVISQSCFFSCIESAKPKSGSVLGKSDFSNSFAPIPLSHSPVEFCRLWRS